MVRKKIDNRLRVMIENGVANNHRSMFVIVGDKGRDQVVILHHMLSKATVKARPSVLWCYKKELGFSSHRKKRMRQLQKKIKSGKLNMKDDDPFELFISATNIRYCYYAETHKILGNTYGMCVLQDFEALSPNLLARTVETVEGGGLVVLLLKSMDSLRQLYTLSMDVHSRFRTESHNDVVGRFNERFILSLASCKNCLVIDDQLNVLPISQEALNITPVPPKPIDEPLSPAHQELVDLKASLADTQPLGVLVGCCKTLDQARGLLKFIEAISEKTLRSTVTMTAARGRGKSAALGLAMASAVAFGYSNIFVTSPSPENLKTMFEFIFKGFDALEYQEHLDYELVQSTNPEFNKAIVRVNIFREHRQTIQYVHPSDAVKLGQAELLCIDEAAAIPLPLVKALMGPYLVFMASTINGYEGTGRSLSLKLIHQLRQQSSGVGTVDKADQTTNGTTSSSATGRILHEVSLEESIRYSMGDPVERWLYDVLCLDAASVPRVSSGCPVPSSCELYYVNRDTLFSYHKASEKFLQRLMALYVASHYKNTPNDLQLLSDAPAHHVFVLLGPVNPEQNSLPEIIAVLQVCLEGEISKGHVMSSLQRGKRAAGDLIPWTVSQQFQDHDFPSMSGARVVRIATHPDYQGMGYGSRALELLSKYYEGRLPSMVESDAAGPTSAPTVDKENVGLLEEKLTPRKNLPPLLLKLSERPAEPLHYLGVSYGMTKQLLKFWKCAGYAPVYLRQTPNELTGEHSCIMLRLLNAASDDPEEEENAAEDSTAASTDNSKSWMCEYWRDFRRRFISLLGYQFSSFPPATAMSMLQCNSFKENKTDLSWTELSLHMTQYDLKRLQLYSQNMVDWHLIVDLLPALARLYFTHKINISLSNVQEAILLSLGLQYKSVDKVASELGLPSSQILGLFNRTIRKASQCLDSIAERPLADAMPVQRDVTLEPLPVSMDAELDEAAGEASQKHKGLYNNLDLEQYAIRGAEDDWSAALSGGKSGIISVKGKAEKRRKVEDSDISAMGQDRGKSNKKHKKHKHKQ